MSLPSKFRSYGCITTIWLLLAASDRAGAQVVDYEEVARWHREEAHRAHQWVGYYGQMQQDMAASDLVNRWRYYEQANTMWALHYQCLAVDGAANESDHAESSRLSGYSVARASGPPPVVLRNGYAYCWNALPMVLQHLIGSGNAIQDKPYILGGGHRRLEDDGYDCSGAVSYVLIKAGLLRSPVSSQGFASFGKPGEGRWLTIWVKPGKHVFLTVCGVRLDTTGGSKNEGPRWRSSGRDLTGFVPRHPVGW